MNKAVLSERESVMLEDQAEKQFGCGVWDKLAAPG
jgi:hypothetical protein